MLPLGCINPRPQNSPCYHTKAAICSSHIGSTQTQPRTCLGPERGEKLTQFLPPKAAFSQLNSARSTLFFSPVNAQARPTLCDPRDCGPPGSFVHGILQARILEGVAVPSSRGSSQPRDRTRVSCVSCIGRRVLYHQRPLGSPLSSQSHLNTSIESIRILP